MERKFQAGQNGRADYAKCLISNELPHPSTRRSFCAPGGYHAGRIAKTVRSRSRNLAKKSSNCFHGTYFWFSSRIPCSASAPVTISARASTHSPFNPPRMSHGAIRTRGLFRMRFTFPETPIVYTYNFASLESRLADGSAANHTGVFTPSPLFLNVSRFKYLCPANASNPIASLPRQFATTIRCLVYYTRHKHKRRSGPAGAPYRETRLLLGVLVRLHHAEEISFGVLEIRKVADRGNRRLGHDQLSACLLHGFHCGVNRFHADRVGCRLHIRIFHEAAVDPWGPLRARGHHPVLHGPRPFLNFPAEHFFVEDGSAFRIARRYFKMYDSRHDSPPDLYKRNSTPDFPALTSASPTLAPHRSAAWRNPQSFPRCYRA